MIKNKGLTLIETIIYLGLFSIMIGGLIVVVFNLIQSSEKLASKDTAQIEINFVFKKLDWLLMEAKDLTVSVDKKFLTLKPGDLVLKLENNKIVLDGQALTTENVEVQELLFEKIDSKPLGLKVYLKVKEKNTFKEVENNYLKFLKI